MQLLVSFRFMISVLLVENSLTVKGVFWCCVEANDMWYNVLLIFAHLTDKRSRLVLLTAPAGRVSAQVSGSKAKPKLIPVPN